MNHSLIIITLVNFYNENCNNKKIDTHNTQTHDRSHSWLGTGTPIKRGSVKLLN